MTQRLGKDLGPDGSTGRTTTDRDVDILELYREYRAYVVHEDTLMNNRVNWFIQLHSFLIASYVIVTCGIVTSFFPSGRVPDRAQWIQTIAALVCVGVAAVGHRSATSAVLSIRATTEALNRVRDQWDELYRSNPTRYRLPDLTYGGERPGWMGTELEGALPELMKRVWVVASLFSVAYAVLAWYVGYA